MYERQGLQRGSNSRMGRAVSCASCCADSGPVSIASCIEASESCRLSSLLQPAVSAAPPRSDNRACAPRIGPQLAKRQAVPHPRTGQKSGEGRGWGPPVWRCCGVYSARWMWYVHPFGAPTRHKNSGSKKALANRAVLSHARCFWTLRVPPRDMAVPRVQRPQAVALGHTEPISRREGKIGDPKCGKKRLEHA